MALLREYKCPCCGGAIAFDSTAQKLKCPYCDTEFEAETLAAFDKELKNEPADDMKWDDSTEKSREHVDADGLITYLCKSCGGEIIGDENTVATSCPFCGNPVIVLGKVSGSLKPDLVIPFKLDKKAAKETLKKHYEGKKLLPKVFGEENHLDEIRGVYVPFWLFDASVDAHIRYKATRVRLWSDHRYNYSETSYYSVLRGGGISFDDVPVDGSAKITDELMESLEPFDLSEAVDFKTAYLAGYLADKYDIDEEQSMVRANERIKRSTESAFAATVQGYASVSTESSGIKLKKGKVKYALFPVWLLNTTWNGEKYTFAMNGQTGKFVGNLPMDKAAYRKELLKWTGIIGAIALAATYLIWLV